MIHVLQDVKVINLNVNLAGWWQHIMYLWWSVLWWCYGLWWSRELLYFWRHSFGRQFQFWGQSRILQNKSGELCVMTSGIEMKLLLCADNLDTPQKVNAGPLFHFATILAGNTDWAIFLSTDAWGLCYASYGQGDVHQPIFLDNVRYMGVESALDECIHRTTVYRLWPFRRC